MSNLNHLPPNLDTLKFVQTLRQLPSPEAALNHLETFQTYSDLSKGEAEHQSGTLQQMLETLTAWEALGKAVHLMVNTGDGLGRSKGNVTEIVGIWADLDTQEGTESFDLAQCQLPPTMMVASSPENRHLYWLFRQPIKATPEHKLRAEALMRSVVALTLKWGCDSQCAEVARVLRLPGYRNNKPKHHGHVVSLLFNNGPRYTIDELEAAFPPIPVVPSTYLPIDESEIAHISVETRLDMAERYLENCEASVQGAGGSTACIKAAGKCFTFGLQAEDVFDLMMEVFNPRCRPAWSEKEMDHKVSDAQKFALQNGTFGRGILPLGIPMITNNPEASDLQEGHTAPEDAPDPELEPEPHEGLDAPPDNLETPQAIATPLETPRGHEKGNKVPAPRKLMKEQMISPVSKDPVWTEIQKMRPGTLKALFPYLNLQGETYYYRLKREVGGEPIMDYLTLWFSPKSSAPDHLEWRIGFEPKDLHLCGLPNLSGTGKVLLVEGEEFAGNLSKLLPEMRVVAGPLSDIKKVLRTDWQQLKGQDVVIFAGKAEIGVARGCARSLVKAEVKKVSICPTLAEVPAVLTAEWAAAHIAQAVEFTAVAAKNPYEILEGVYYLVDAKNPVKLCNFTATLHSTIRYIEGNEDQDSIKSHFEISGITDGAIPLKKVRITADDLSDANWFSYWEPYIDFNHNAQQVRKHVTSAIKQFSGGIPPETVVYKHIGWTKIDGQDVYLHNSGCITANRTGIEGIRAELNPASPLRGVKFSEPLQGEERRQNIRQVLTMFDLIRNDTLTSTLIGFPVLATFGGVSFGLQFKGQTGYGKSGAGAIMANFFDPSLTYQKLHQSWREVSDANLGLILFDGKDCVTAIDDFEKDDSPQVTQKRVTLLEGALWALGGSSKGRNTSSGDYRATKPCRTSLILTGQDTCLKKSGVVRMLILDVPPLMSNERRDDYLTVAGWGKSGVLNQFMASWLHTMAKGVDVLKAELKDSIGRRKDSIERHLDSIGCVGHARTNSSIADILGVWPLVLKWAQEEGAITLEESEAYWARAYKGCLDLLTANSDDVESTDPVNIFLQLPGLLRSKVCHLTECSTSGSPMKMPEAFGWVDGRPCGPHIAYIDLPARKIYLEEVAFKFIDSKLNVGHEWKTFKKLLDKRGLLIDKGVGGDGGLKCAIPGNHGRGYCISMDSFKDWSGPEWDQLNTELKAALAGSAAYRLQAQKQRELHQALSQSPIKLG